MRSATTRFSGLIILLLGIWGGAIPYVGPYFNFTIGPDKTWTWTTGRLWLSLLPAIAAVIGGLMLMVSGPRLGGRLGALLALAGGIWLVIGPTLSALWYPHAQEGLAHGGRYVQMFEHLSFHTGLGALITALAAFALPSFLLARHRVAAAEGAAVGAGAGAATTTAGPATSTTGRRRRRRFFGGRHSHPGVA